MCRVKRCSCASCTEQRAKSRVEGQASKLLGGFLNQEPTSMVSLTSPRRRHFCSGAEPSRHDAPILFQDWEQGTIPPQILIKTGFIVEALGSRTFTC